MAKTFRAYLTAGFKSFYDLESYVLCYLGMLIQNDLQGFDLPRLNETQAPKTSLEASML